MLLSSLFVCLFVCFCLLFVLFCFVFVFNLFLFLTFILVQAVSTQLKCGTNKADRYQIVPTTKSWSDARQYCKGIGGDLVIIDDDEEMDFVNSLTDSGVDEYWIGLSDTQDEGTICGGNLLFQKGIGNNSVVCYTVRMYL